MTDRLTMTLIILLFPAPANYQEPIEFDPIECDYVNGMELVCE